MSNPNDPAYPNASTFVSESHAWTSFPGLTKREAFAMAAMQGLLAKHEGYSEDSKLCMAQAAVACADALLKELAKEGGQ